MDLPFDAQAESDKLAEIRTREEEELAELLSQKYGLTYVDLSLKEIDNDALRVVTETEARSAEAIAFAKVESELSLAVRNPESPAVKKLVEELATRGYHATLALCSKRSIERGLLHYRDLSYAKASKVGELDVPQETLAIVSASGFSKAEMKKAFDEAIALKPLDRVSRLLELIMAGALTLRSSDIHLEPEEKQTNFRLRVDGLLALIYTFDPATYHQLNSRLKLLSGVKLNLTHQAQDGRFTFVVADKAIEVRVSFIPGNYGESIVMRLLDPSSTMVSYRDLGIPDKLLTRLESEIRRPNGMLLTTGPTGSGKTTTLYSFLREIHTPENKIITIEDPIEYHLEGIVQTQVAGKTYTFAEGLRSIVRQDPDVIMVGEIRDGETANIAIQAALTGHFVFSTIHTNSAAGTFPRLVDLGADPKSFGSAVTVAMAQRLVRKLDPAKRKERPMTAEEKAVVEQVLETIVDKSLLPEKHDTLFEPGDLAEGETGYHGRIGLYEAIFMDDDLASFLRDNPPENEVAKAVTRQGYLTMTQDGVLKALAGITSLSELGGVVDLPRA